MSYRQPDGSGLCIGRHRSDPDRPRKAAPGGHLCLGCIDRTQRLLDGLPDLIDDLERALIAADNGHSPKVSGSPTRGLAYNDEASKARRGILDRLESWTRLIADERNERLPSDLSPRGLAEWQSNRLQAWTIAQPWVDEYTTNLQEAVREGRSALQGSRSRLLTLGDCKGHTACDVETQFHYPCPGKVKARVDLVDDLLPAAVACTDCGQIHTARELPALGKAMTGGVAWLTTAQAAYILGLSENQTRLRAIAEGWQRRDHEKVRPSRWDSEDVQKSRKRYERAKGESA